MSKKTTQPTAYELERASTWLTARGFAGFDFRGLALSARDPKDITMATPLHRAAFEGDSWICLFLCANGAALDIKNRNNPAKKTPLYLACGQGHKQVAQILSAWSHPSERFLPDAFGRTPLHEACLRGHLHIVRWLCESFEDTPLAIYGEEVSGNSILSTASSDGTGSNSNRWTGSRTVPSAGVETPFAAQSSGAMDLLRLKDAVGFTPLCAAASNFDVATCHYLLLRGALHSSDDEGNGASNAAPRRYGGGDAHGGSCQSSEASAVVFSYSSLPQWPSSSSSTSSPSPSSLLPQVASSAVFSRVRSEVVGQLTERARTQLLVPSCPELYPKLLTMLHGDLSAYRTFVCTFLVGCLNETRGAVKQAEEAETGHASSLAGELSHLKLPVSHPAGSRGGGSPLRVLGHPGVAGLPEVRRKIAQFADVPSSERTVRFLKDLVMALKALP